MVSPILINASEQVSGTPVGSGTIVGNPVSGGTSGAVLFVDNTGNLSQSPSTFVWGVTNSQLALGTNNPLAQLHVKQSTMSYNAVTGIAIEGWQSNAGVVNGHLPGAQTDLAYYISKNSNSPGKTSEYIRFKGDTQALSGALGTVYYGIEIHDDYPVSGVTGLTSVHYLSVGSTGVGVDTRTGFANLSVGGNVAIGYDYTYASWTVGNSYIPPANGLIVEGPTGINTTTPGAWLDVVGNATVNGLTLRSQTAIQFNDTSSKWVGFQSPATVTTSAIWKLPIADGTVGQFLKTDGALNLAWASAGGASAIGGNVSGGQTGSVLFIDGSGNLQQDNSNFYYSNTLHKLAVGLTTTALATGRITSLVGATGNMEGLFVSQSDTTGNSNAARIVTTGGGNSLSIYHRANTAITDFAGAITLDNTTNTGIGVNVYSNQSAPNASGSLIRAHAANAGFTAPAVYVRNDGTAVGIPTLRLDAYSPLVYFSELNQIAPAGLYAIDGKNDFLRITGRRVDNSTFDPFVVFQRLDSGGSNLGGTVGIRTGVNTGNSTLQVNGSLAVGVNSVSAPYSAGNTDEYITVNASAYPNGLTISLPQVSGVAGRIVHILKSDTTNNFVGIAPFAGDTVYGASSKQIFAKGQVVSVISDGTTNWNPYGKMAYSPTWIGNTLDAGYTGSVGTANTAVLVAVENKFPVTVNGIRLNVTASSGNVDVGVYDSTGLRLGSSGSTACPAGKSTINLGTPASVYSKGICYLALAADNNTATFSCSGADAIMGVYSFPASFPLPASFSLTGLTATNLPFALAGIVAGGLTI